MTFQLSQGLARFATAGAVVALAASLAAHHPDAATASESGFLALLCGLVLAALAFGRRTTPATVVGGALVAVALWLPAAEGSRGALIGLLLVVTVGWATWRTLATTERATWLETAAVVLAWQALLRSERLLHFAWTPRTAVWLLALPLAAALALWWHGRQADGPPALVLLAALAGLGPGWSVLAVAVLVIAVTLTSERLPTWPAATLATAAGATAIWWQPAAGPSLLVLITALSWRRHAFARWLPALGALAWVGLGALDDPSVGALAWLVASLPLALLAPRAERPLLAAALVLALAPAPAAAPALALAALTLPATGPWRRLQAAWSLGLLAALAVAAAYPWLRQSPAAPPFAVSSEMLALAAAAALTAGALALTYHRSARLPSRSAPLALGAVLVGGAMLAPAPPLISDPVVLSRSEPALQVALPAGEVSELTLDSFVSGSGSLESGRSVARIHLTSGDGSRREIDVRLGQHTADWAARRLGGPAAIPTVWLSWLAADGTLAQRYRARWTLDSPIAVRGLEIERPDDLPPTVEVAILAVSLR
jgi:hypothetical protein